MKVGSVSTVQVVPFHGICYSSMDFRLERRIGNRAIWKWNWKFGIPFGNGKYIHTISLSLFSTVNVSRYFQTF